MPSLISQMRNGQPQQQMQPRQPQIDPEYLANLRTMLHSSNPQQYLNALAAKNPQVQQMMQMVQNSGNPEQVFRMLAKSNGIDPEYIINQLMS